MIVYSVKEVGACVRQARKVAGLTQRQLAENCRCGTRFISDLENGKPTVEFGRVLLVLNVLSLDIQIVGR